MSRLRQGIIHFGRDAFAMRYVTLLNVSKYDISNDERKSPFLKMMNNFASGT